MTRAIGNRVTYGDAVLSRFAAVGAPASIKGDLAIFKAQHGVFVKETGAVQKAEAAYDTAAKKVAKLDGDRDATVLAIADKMPGAKLGRRNSPFADFSKYPPTKLVALPYAAETNELRALLPAILDKHPPHDIAALCKKGLAQNEAVDAALKDLSAPLTVLNEARARRDAAIPDWEKHLRRLRDSSAVAFRDEAGRLEALFAEPDAVQTNVRPKPRKAKKTEGAGEVKPEGGQALAAPAAKRAKHKARRKPR